MPELREIHPSRWDAALRDLGVTDVYCTRGYLEASAALADGTPTLLHLAGDGGDVIFPLLLRSDPVDVVSPYGYGGPVALGEDPPVAAFAAAYSDWCARRGAITSFVLYHPLFANQELAEPTGFHRIGLDGTVAWALDAGELLPGMHRHHRRVVRKALREGFETRVARPESLEDFVPVYEASMRRAGASDYYFFDSAYWSGLLASVPLVRSDVLSEGRLVASMLGMGEPPWLHYHLGGTVDGAGRSGASHLALLGLAEWGREHGYSLLHLGGGVGGREDSLLEYKLRFAPDGLRPAAVGKALHDPGAYAELTGSAEVDWGGFFPAYRASR
ncbi:MAG TPA: GNAT family N-acetyltransferase [Solirubrobacteraceae bacterium]|nr:GNAT family N-acetyltransferase [Solirubrobacteraceae bacterium]